MTHLIFATGNQRKIIEATNALGRYNIEFIARKLEVDEIQHHDPAEITKAKAVDAYAVAGQPVVVSDTSWNIPALGGFPGGYMKDIAAWWQPEDWLAVMDRHADKRIMCLEHLAYYDGHDLKHFEVQYEGRFTDVIRGRRQSDESFESLVILYGNQTMAEQLEAGEVASASDDLRHWQQFGEWYAARKKE